MSQSQFFIVRVGIACSDGRVSCFADHHCDDDNDGDDDDDEND